MGDQPVDCRIISSIDEFRGLGEQWEGLLLASRLGGEATHPFLSHGWILGHLEVFEEDSLLRFVTLWGMGGDGKGGKRGDRGDRGARGEATEGNGSLPVLLAAAPLVLRQVHRWGGIPLPGRLGLRLLQTPANPHTPRGGWLLGREQGKTMAALWEGIKAQDDWDVMEIRDLPLGSSTERRLSELAKLAKKGFINPFE